MPSAATVSPQVQRFSIRIPKNTKKKYNVMRFNAGAKVDFQEWKQAKIQRENNIKDFKGVEDEMPKFGAGSEFGREAREKARRSRFGITSHKYKSENQPWILKPNGKNGRKFKGIKEGGVGENCAYYIFAHAGDDAIEAYPLHEWYNFQPIQRYKTLNAEEAEEEFSKRDRVMNYFSVMLKKRLNNEDGEEDADLADTENGKRSSRKKEKDFKISEMDEWIVSDEDDDSDSDDKENQNKSDNEDDDKKKKKGKYIKKKKQKNASDDEAFEESDDGDEEGRECEYISDSSASESELEQEKDIKSVAEESGLRQLLASDEEEDDEEDKDKKTNANEECKEEDNKSEASDGKNGDKKKAKKKNKKKDDSGSSSDFESGEKNKDNDKSQSSSATMSHAGPSNSRKRTLSSSSDSMSEKKFKFETKFSGSSESGITEDAVRRYLMRKPMTTTDLLQKFRAKKTGVSSEKIVIIMTRILKNINPTSQKIKGKMYYSIEKPSNRSN